MRRPLLLGLSLLLAACVSAPRPAPVLLSPSELPRVTGHWHGSIQPMGGLTVLTDSIITADGVFTTPARRLGESGRLWILDDGRIGFETGLSQGIYTFHDDGTRSQLLGQGTYKTTGREFRIELTRQP